MRVVVGISLDLPVDLEFYAYQVSYVGKLGSIRYASNALEPYNWTHLPLVLHLRASLNINMVW